MCFQVGLKSKFKIAKKDIIVLKQLSRNIENCHAMEGVTNFVSPFQNMNYELGKLYGSRITIDAKMYGRTYDEYSEITKDKIKVLNEFINEWIEKPDYSLSVTEGLHSYKIGTKGHLKRMNNGEWMKPWWPEVNCIAIIPKGSIYIENFNQYVSNYLIVKEVVYYTSPELPQNEPSGKMFFS